SVSDPGVQARGTGPHLRARRPPPGSGLNARHRCQTLTSDIGTEGGRVILGRAVKKCSHAPKSCSMSLVPSLLQAIVHVDGGALVMGAGAKPYVVAPTGQVDLATRGLALDAVNGIVSQLLPAERQQALNEFGAVQYELPAVAEFPGEHFTIVAARSNDDLWVEIRRRRIPDEDQLPAEFFMPPDGAAKADPSPVYSAPAARDMSRGVEPNADALSLGADDLRDLGLPEPARPPAHSVDMPLTTFTRAHAEES